jgi:large subunit ribosomal protein L32
VAVPKKRQSRSRRDSRRANYKISAAVFNECEKCGSPKQPHRVCPSCGWYADRYVLETREVEG